MASTTETDLGRVSKSLGQPQSSGHRLRSQLTSSSGLKSFTLALLCLGLAISGHQNKQDSHNRWLSTVFNSARTPFSSSVVFKAAFLRVCEISIQVPCSVLTGHHGEEQKRSGVGWGGVAFLFLCFKYIHIFFLNNQFLGAKEMCKLPNQGLASPQGQKLTSVDPCTQSSNLPSTGGVHTGSERILPSPAV